MKTLFAVALLLVSSLVAVAQKPAPLPNAPEPVHFLSDIFYPATMLLFHQEVDGSMTFNCTASAIHHDDSAGLYVFLTAAHCIHEDDTDKDDDDNDVDTYYLSADERGAAKAFLRVIPNSVHCGKPSDGTDLCVLAVRSDDPIPTLEIGDDPITGEDVVTVSAPAGIGKQVFYGYVSSSRLDRHVKLENGAKWDGYAVLQMPGVIGGSSGSILVCRTTQKVCGVIVGIYANGQGQIQFAVPISRLEKVLDDANKKKDKAEKKKK